MEFPVNYCLARALLGAYGTTVEETSTGFRLATMCLIFMPLPAKFGMGTQAHARMHSCMHTRTQN